MSDWKVLVPVEVLEGETVPESVATLLSTVPVVVLGYHVLPEQTPPGQARMQFEDRAQAKLDDIVALFADAGGAAETRLVFTHDEEQTIDRVADETGCSAVLIPNPAPSVEQLLVPVDGVVDTDRLTGFVAALVGDRDIGVTLFHVANDETADPAGRQLVEDAATRLRDRGLSGANVTTEVVVGEGAVDAIATAAVDHDAVVMGERDSSLRSFLFGDLPEQVAAQSLGSVVVVRRERTADPEESGAE